MFVSALLRCFTPAQRRPKTPARGKKPLQVALRLEALEDRAVPTVGIGHRCYIRNAIVDKNCRIGDDVRINGGHHLENSDHSLYTVKEGVVVIKKGAVLPNGFVI